MKLIILCVDGFDPDYADKNGHVNARAAGVLHLNSL
jgi:hypothetical protein